MNTDGDFRWPTTWANGVIYGATTLNYNLYNNILALDNFANPVQHARTMAYPLSPQTHMGNGQYAPEIISTRPMFVPWTRHAGYGTPQVRFRARVDLFSGSNTNVLFDVTFKLYQHTIPKTNLVSATNADTIYSFTKRWATYSRSGTSALFYDTGWKSTADNGAALGSVDQGALYLGARLRHISGITLTLYRTFTTVEFGLDTDTATAAPRY